MRNADRLFSAAVVVGAVVCLLAVPIALAVGTTTYACQAARIRARDVGKAEFVATVVSDPVYVRSRRIYVAEAQFREGEALRSVFAPVGNFAVRGKSTWVWVGADGTVTEPPAAAGTALLRGIGDGLGILAAIWMVVWTGLALIWWRVQLRHAWQWREQYWSLVWLGH